MVKHINITKDEVNNIIRDFIANSPLNSLQDGTKEPAWDQALVGFASGADAIWQQYKEYIGAFHWTPWEVFNQHCPETNVTAKELTVISWVLPQTKLVRKANRRAKTYPAEEWARIRVYGEEFNMGLRRHLVENLIQSGCFAVAPMVTPNWTIVKSERFSYASSWSERHAAHAAGLGTFGLCDGLITAKGKAMRTGSIVAKVMLEPDPRPYEDHHAYCLYYADGTCGKCIDRCPARAITVGGHDKEKCREHLALSRKYVKKTYKFEGYGCGLCQVGVPCETMIPVKAAREALKLGELPPSPPPLA
ncbi:MAG: epoxyqueuosine reductase [Desulfobacteraceae bacterium]|nr:epoxyqueuosine reductase [Desulfobacteraceae bacterium]